MLSVKEKLFFGLVIQTTSFFSSYCPPQKKLEMVKEFVKLCLHELMFYFSVLECSLRPSEGMKGVNVSKLQVLLIVTLTILVNTSGTSFSVGR